MSTRNLKNPLLFIAFLCLCSLVMAQSPKDMKALAMYNKAETAYQSELYEEALDDINQAETILGKTNSKILYLKVNILNQLAKIDNTKVVPLKRAINQFYQLTDQSTYPSQKYMDIVNIELDLNKKLKEEEDAYAKLKDSQDPEVYNTFLQKYPYSKHFNEVKEKYDRLSAELKDKQQKEFVANWKQKNIPLLNSLQKKQKITKNAGFVLLGGGVVMLISGLIALPPKVTDTYGETQRGTLYTSWEYEPYTMEYYPVTQIDRGHVRAAVTVMGIGTVSLIAGGILELVSSDYHTRINKIKKDAAINNISLTLAPASFAPSTLCLGFQLKF